MQITRCKIYRRLRNHRNKVTYYFSAKIYKRTSMNAMIIFILNKKLYRQQKPFCFRNFLYLFFFLLSI